VGGAVRNALLGAPVIDIDIAVPVSPQEAQRRLEGAGIKVVPTGIDHGTVTAIKNDKVFEVTSLRRDVETEAVMRWWPIPMIGRRTRRGAISP